jgi:hypothetical protein
VVLGRFFRSLVAKLALWFRLGRAGYPNEPAPQAPRPRLHELPRIVTEMGDRGILPSRSEGRRLVWRYVCYYVDTSTGQRMSGSRTWTVETDLAGTHQLASARARQLTMSEPSYLNAEYRNNPVYRLVCKSIGEPWVLPTQPD